ncbi:Elongin-A2 [Plecturocebus cupreus]
MAAASTTLHAVEKLQVRLATKTDPKKLGKYLHKLSALPMTADILAWRRESGRRGPLKKPLLVNPNTRPGPDPQDREESSSQSAREALQDQENAWGFPENEAVPRSRSHSPEHRRTAHTTPPGPGDLSEAPQSPGRNREKAPQNCPRGLEPEQQAGRGQADAARAGLCSPRLPGPTPGRSGWGPRQGAQILPPGERRVDVPGRGQSPFQQGDILPGPLQRGNPKATLPGKRQGQTAPASAGTQKEGGRHGGSGLGLPAWAVAPDGHPERPRRRHSHRKRPGLDGPDPRKGTHGLSAGSNSSFPATQRLKSGSHRPLLGRYVGGLPLRGAEEREKDCEIFRTARGDQQRRTNRSKGTRESRASPLKLPPVKESHSERLREAGADSSGRETVLGQGFSELWDLSEPWMQANHDLLSAFESMTSQPQTETARPHRRSRIETGASGGRVNAKMQVYSAPGLPASPRG